MTLFDLNWGSWVTWPTGRMCFATDVNADPAGLYRKVEYNGSTTYYKAAGDYWAVIEVPELDWVEVQPWP